MSAGTPQADQVHALSCVNCRQRKVKCAKVHPCPQCVRAGLDCVFPARKKDRAPRRNKNHELLNRLAKLEAIVGQVGTGSESIATTAAAGAAVAQDSPQHLPSSAPCRNPNKRCPAAEPTSRDDPAAKYVSGEFWANLSAEVEGIKAALEVPSDSEGEVDDGDGDGDGAHSSLSPSASVSQNHYHSPGNYVVSPAMLGSVHTVHITGKLQHPSPDITKKLLHVYFRNVDSLLKILHRPTIEAKFDMFMINPDENPPSPPIEALWFAMYFAAITSMRPESCIESLGQERAQLVTQYGQSVEVALARADYLNNTAIECLQALTIYDACLRSHTRSRTSWALLALVYRLAQAIGLQRDGLGSSFTPYEAEMRRRLWAQIIVLDVRAAQDRGTEPMVQEDIFNTAPPTNLNDDDFNPGTTILPAARQGPSDVIFSLCTYHCSRLYLHIHGPRSAFSKPPGDEPSGSTTPALTSTSSEEDVIGRIKALEAQFVEPALANPGHFPSAMAAAVVRLTTLITWLTIQYPLRVRQPTVKPRVSHEHMLQTAVAILDLAAYGPAGAGTGISQLEWRERFEWWQDGYVQWHALAVALVELCVQTDGLLVDRAWATVDKALALWGDKVADTRRGALWRPIRKLVRKAREKRADAQRRKLNPQQQQQQQENEKEQEQTQRQTKQRVQRDTEMSYMPYPQSPREVLARLKAEAEAGTEATQANSEDDDAQHQTYHQVRTMSASSKATKMTAATEMGPTGIPFAADFGDMSSMSPFPASSGTAINAPSSSAPAPAPTSGTTTQEVTGTPSVLTAGAPAFDLPHMLLYENAHNMWTIDFANLDSDVAMGGIGNDLLLDPALEQQTYSQPPQQQSQQGLEQEQLLVDWSVWNDFVLDANVGLEDGSTSSEGGTGR
ncbi:fungal-specific transcription factor domain-domain-containing protein [Coniella lustricola]|uniref:Fungal-specific transcription factor domain-domain-containing protein n=1 Tax=Coniella lustricola TaxID=2025994 RepID=A0A2T3AEM8_9PEZI|nr:fungal-specific transcription factor domain-domain-containing protein [Coniella lustricola]